MATPVIMPRQGQTVESCIIAKWHKKKGDKVQVGDILFTYETDKATFDEEAQVDGILLDIFFEEGDDVPVLTNVCVIGEEGENPAEFAPEGAGTAAEEETAQVTDAPVAEQKAASAPQPVGDGSATPVIMPRQGQTVESCIIAKWHKKKGDKVQVGDILFTYETDKATFDEEAQVEGILLDIFFEEGDDVPVLTNVCVIGEEGADASIFDPRKQDVDKVEEKAAESEIPAPQVEAAAPVQQPVAAMPGERFKISPRARNLAELTGLDYRYAKPTGPYGRIIERDILAMQETGPFVTASARDEYQKMDQKIVGTGLGGRITTEDLQKASVAPAAAGLEAPVAAPAPAEEDYVDVKLTNIRKVIARAMHQSLSTTAQLTLNASFDATDILNYRKKIKENRERLGLENITINDIILYAVSRTILDHKDLNAHVLDDKMRIFNNVHLGVAVDTERGLMVPTIFNANKKSLNEISREVKALVSSCKQGTINPDLLRGASFTITNLGTLDIESFTPVLNPPQTGILGVNTVVQRAKEVNGEIVYYPAMGLSLTFDHRALDGAPAARFLKDLKTNLENFSILLAK
ncbi:MAG: 2-oxo acid dehydrogenase subunit E2 [Clostridia bacterium]|jgi:pyruvate dehydrogenase E2 component (dihydrolipoamide acetyltransferase)